MYITESDNDAFMVLPLVALSMAQAITADATEAEHVEKTITLIAYSAEHRANPRNFAEEFADIDMFEEETKEEHDRTMWTLKSESFWSNDGKVETSYISEDEYEALKNVTAPEHGVWVTDNVTTTTRKKNKPTDASRDLMDRITSEECPETVGDLEKSNWGPRWRDEDSMTHVSIRDNDVKERDVLAHQSVRSADNRFEETVPRMSLQWTITMDGTPAEIETYTQEIVNPVMTQLGRHENISKVRLSACQETVTKAGDCFDGL